MMSARYAAVEVIPKKHTLIIRFPSEIGVCETGCPYDVLCSQSLKAYEGKVVRIDMEVIEE